MFKKIWNSKAMDLLVDMYDIAVGTFDFMGEVLVDVFSNNDTNSSTSYSSLSSYSYEPSSSSPQLVKEDNDTTYSVPKLSVEEETYNYWMSLSSLEQEEYFERNEYLQRWGENYKYADKWQMAKSVAEIARRENRAFTDKWDRW